MPQQVYAPAPPKENFGLRSLNDDIAAQFDALEKSGQLPTLAKPEDQAEPEPAQDQPVDEPVDEPVDDANDEPVDDPATDDDDLPDVDEGSHKLAKEFGTSDDDDDDDVPDTKHTRADDDDAKEDIDDIQNNPHTPEKTRKSINRLLGKTQSLKKALKERDAELASLQGRLEALESQQPQESGVTAEERHELNMLRRRYQIDSDDTIKQEFDAKISVISEDLNRVVEENLERDVAAEIQKIGFEKFAQKYPRAYKEFIEKLEDVAPLDADMVKANLGEMRSLRLQRERKIRELVADADKYFADQEAQASKNTQSIEQQRRNVAEIRKATYDNITQKDENFVLLDTKGLKGEQLKLAEAENARRQKYHQHLHKIVNARTHEDQVETIYRAALTPVLADRLHAANKTIKQLQASLKAIKGNQGIRKPKPQQDTPPAKPARPTSFSESLDAAMGQHGGTVVIPQ